MDLSGPAADQFKYFIDLFENEEKGIFKQSREESDQLLGLKMFKLFRDYYQEDEDDRDGQNEELSKQEFSLDDLIKLGAEFCEDKIFESCLCPARNLTTVNASDNDKEQFHYFQFRVITLSEEDEEERSGERPRIVIEVKDVSGKLLYGEAQAQKQYMTMMQATTRHECMQPLTSITYQLQSLQKILKQSIKQEKMMKVQL